MQRLSERHPHMGDCWRYLVQYEHRAIEVVVMNANAHRRRVINAVIHQRVTAAEADTEEICDVIQGFCHLEGCILLVMNAYERLVPPPVGMNDTWSVPEAFWQFLELACSASRTIA